jgi:hypothetical protein
MGMNRLSQRAFAAFCSFASTEATRGPLSISNGTQPHTF